MLYSTLCVIIRLIYMKGLVCFMDLCIKRIVVGPVRTNCYIVNKKGSSAAVIIDPGDEAFEIERRLTELKLVPEAILLTHGHFDHIGAVSTLKAHFGIKVYAYESEKEILTTEMNLGRMVGESLCVDADVYLADGFILNVAGINFKLIHTPGHTIGSCCYLVEDEKVLFSGDTMFYHSHGRTDFPTGSQSAIIRSIIDKLLVLDDDITVYPGHEEETTISSERMLYDIN